MKALVDDLEAARLSRGATRPARVSKPWGWFQTVDLGERFRVKRIVILPGRMISRSTTTTAPSTGWWSAERPKSL